MKILCIISWLWLVLLTCIPIFFGDWWVTAIIWTMISAIIAGVTFLTTLIKWMER